MLARSVGFLLDAVACALEAFDLDNVERTTWAASSAAPSSSSSTTVGGPPSAPHGVEDDEEEGSGLQPPPAQGQPQQPPPSSASAAAVAQEWFLLLHNDDVHGKREVAEALAQHPPLNAHMARKLADQVHEQGEARVHFGPLGDVRALARRLRGRSLLVSLLTRRLLKIGKVALLQVQWLYSLAGVSGGICRLVVEQLIAAPSSSTTTGGGSGAGGAGDDHDGQEEAEAALPRLLRAHGRLGKPLASGLHALYLFLMADQVFKARVARAYADTYLAVAREYGAGVGVAESSLYSLSVQFLNRPAFVNELVGCVCLCFFLFFLSWVMMVVDTTIGTLCATRSTQSITPHIHSKHNFLEVLVQALGGMLQRALLLPPLLAADPEALGRPADGAGAAMDVPRDRRIYGAVDVAHMVLKVCMCVCALG